jgi:hypothetical protein
LLFNVWFKLFKTNVSVVSVISGNDNILFCEL